MNADGAATLAGGFLFICGTLADELEDLRDDAATEPPWIVVGTRSFSLDDIDTAAPLALLVVADLPLGCVIDVAGPGITSALLLVFLAERERGSGRAGTGMLPDDDDAAGVPIFTLIGAAGVGGWAGFAAGIPFACITSVGSLPLDLDLGALATFATFGGGPAFGTIGFGGGGINGFEYPVAPGFMPW